MNDLQEAFVDAIEHLDLPDVDLTATVLDRIAADQPVADQPDADPALVAAEPATADTDPEPRRGRLAMVGAALLIALGLILAATPAGQAVADWFGIGATSFEVDEPGADDPNADEPNAEERGADQPDAEESDGIDDAPTLDLGREIQPTPDIAPIESLGRPDAVFDDPRRGRTYVWNTAAGGQRRLSVRSTAASTFAVKSLASADDVEFLTIEVPNHEGVLRPYPGVWVGAPHTLTYPVEGLDLELSVDAGPVLIWVDADDDIEFRLEGAADKDEAVGYAVETVEGTELLPPG